MLFFTIKILVHLDISITRIPEDTKKNDRDVYKFNFVVIR